MRRLLSLALLTLATTVATPYAQTSPPKPVAISQAYPDAMRFFDSVGELKTQLAQVCPPGKPVPNAGIPCATVIYELDDDKRPNAAPHILRPVFLLTEEDKIWTALSGERDLMRGPLSEIYARTQFKQRQGESAFYKPVAIFGFVDSEHWCGEKIGGD